MRGAAGPWEPRAAPRAAPDCRAVTDCRLFSPALPLRPQRSQREDRDMAEGLQVGAPAAPLRLRPPPAGGCGCGARSPRPHRPPTEPELRVPDAGWRAGQLPLSGGEEVSAVSSPVGQRGHPWALEWCLPSALSRPSQGHPAVLYGLYLQLGLPGEGER